MLRQEFELSAQDVVLLRGQKDEFENRSESDASLFAAVPPLLATRLWCRSALDHARRRTHSNGDVGYNLT